MMDPELKKKIVNTISTYEKKCNSLKIEADTLKSAISQLLELPTGIHIGIDKQLSDLRTDLSNNKTPEVLHQHVENIVNLMSGWGPREKNSADRVPKLLEESTDLLSRVASVFRDKLDFTKMKALLQANADELALLTEFNTLLAQCVLASKKMMTTATSSSDIKPNSSDEAESLDLKISPTVNDSLNQLLEHLIIPDELQNKLETLKLLLQKQISGENLPGLIDKLTELVVDAFTIEESHFKGFLQELTTQLLDFDNHLNFSSETNQKSREDTSLLEQSIQNSIKEIRQDIDNSTSLEELSAKINKSLLLIATRIQSFKKEEDKKLDEYEVRSRVLQDKLMDSERRVEEINKMMTCQKLKINQDSLTCLPNRTAYDEQIVKAHQRWQRGYGELSLAVADIDHFKSINDNFGHLAGDRVLKKVATVFKEAIRTVDFVARYGGEEFIFIFENTNKSDAKVVLDNLRAAIENCDFYYRDSKVMVTVSFGLTSVESTDDFDSFFTRADEAMYQAKHAGRNRVEVI